MSFSILLLVFIPCVDRIIWDNCEFQFKTIDHVWDCGFRGGEGVGVGSMVGRDRHIGGR